MRCSTVENCPCRTAPLVGNITKAANIESPVSSKQIKDAAGKMAEIHKNNACTINNIVIKSVYQIEKGGKAYVRHDTKQGTTS